MTGEYLKIWSKLLDGTKLSHDEWSLLNKFVLDHPEVVPDLADELAVHRTLELKSETKQDIENFVGRCLVEFNSETPVVAPTAENFGIEIDVHSVHQEPIDIEKIKKRNSVVNWNIGILAAAASLVIALFIVVMNRVDFDNLTRKTPERLKNSNQAVGVGLSQQELPDLAPESTGTDSTDRSESTDQDDDMEKSHQLQLPDLVLDEDEIEVDFPEYVAELFVTEKAKFDSQVTSRPTIGKYTLRQGEAILKFENQVVVFALGPAEFELVSKTEIKPLSGRFLIDSAVPDKVAFTVASRDATLSDLESTRFWLDISENGTSVNLSRGNVEMIRDVDDTNSEPVKLGNDGLQNAYVNNVVDDDSRSSPILIAHGINDRYFAQIGWGDKRLQSTTPDEVEDLIRQQSVTNSEVPSVNGQLQSQILQFNARLREMRTRFQSGDGMQENNGNFPGSFFIPSPFHRNQMNPYAKFKEFENFSRQLMNRFPSSR